MKLFPILAFSALTTALTGGFGPHPATKDESPAGTAHVERMSDRARRVVLASELGSLPGMRVGENGRVTIASDIPSEGLWLQVDGDDVVGAGTGAPRSDANPQLATVVLRPLARHTLAVHQDKGSLGDVGVDVTGILKNLNLDEMLGDLTKELGPLLGSVNGMVSGLMDDLKPVIATATELKALKQDGAKATMSDADRKALEQRIAALEKKIEALAEMLSKRFENFDFKFDEKRFEEMGKRIEQRAEEMAKRAEKLAPKADDAKHKALIESELKISAKDRQKLMDDAKKMSAEALKMAEQARQEIRVRFSDQDVKKMADEARAMADKIRQEVRVRSNDQDAKKLADKIRQEVRIQASKDGKAPQVYTFRTDGKGDQAFILDRKLGEMRPMTDDEKKEVEGLRRRLLDEFMMGSAKNSAELEKRLAELMKKRAKGDGPGLFLFGESVKDFPKLFLGEGRGIRIPKPGGDEAGKVRFQFGETSPFVFDGSVLKNMLKGAPGNAMDEKTLDALTKQLDEVRREIEKLREELRKKKDGAKPASTFSLGKAPSSLASWQSPEFEGFGKLRKGWQVPGSDAMAELLDTLTPEQVQRHEEQGYLAISDLTPVQRRMLGEMDVLPWEIGLSLNGRKLNLRTGANARIPAQN